MTEAIHLDEPDDNIDFTLFDQYIDDMSKIIGVPNDWTYHPIGWMRNDFYDQLIDLIGNDNIKLMSSTTRTMQGDMCTRASMWISPQGIENVRKYNERLQPIPERSQHRSTATTDKMVTQAASTSRRFLFSNSS